MTVSNKNTTRFVCFFFTYASALDSTLKKKRKLISKTHEQSSPTSSTTMQRRTNDDDDDIFGMSSLFGGMTNDLKGWSFQESIDQWNNEL